MPTKERDLIGTTIQFTFGVLFSENKTMTMTSALTREVIRGAVWLSDLRGSQSRAPEMPPKPTLFCCLLRREHKCG